MSILSEPERAFSAEELAERRTNAAAAMSKQAEPFDLLLLTRDPDIRYFSGFHTQFWQSPTRPWFLLINATGNSIAVIPTIGESALRKTFDGDIRTWSSPDPVDDGLDLLCAAIHELAGAHPRIGTPMGQETFLRLPLKQYHTLTQRLPDASWHDATHLIHTLTQIKSAAEIARIHHCCQIVSRSFGHIVEWLRPGMSEIEVFRQFKMSCLNLGVDNTDYLVGGADNDGYDDIISPPSNRRLQAGDVLMLDTGCTWQGYFCDFDRNFAIGAPSAIVQDVHHRLWDATQAAIEAVRPGVSCSELAAIMAQQLQPASRSANTSNDNSVGRMGHGLGMQLTETPSLVSHDHTVLQAGMVITLEPACPTVPGKSMVHEENLLVTETGATLLTNRAPRDIPIIN